MEPNKAAGSLEIRKARYNVWLLSLGNAVKTSQSMLIVAVMGLVGKRIAPDPSLATLPLSLQFPAIMIVTIPVAMWLPRFGAKACFMAGALICVAGGAVMTWAVAQNSFILLCVGIALVGVFNGVTSYYRFVAADQSPPEYKSRAIAYVLGGGVLAAFVGGNLARVSGGWLDGPPFLGSAFAIFLLSLLSLPMIALLKLPTIKFDTKKAEGGRKLSVIARQPKFIVAVLCGLLGQFTMNFLMNSTSHAMEDCHHSVNDTTFVIQWHMVAMFAPAFFTGALIKRFGVVSILATGAVLNGLAVAVDLSGTSLVHFTVALLALGIGWNFLFIGATSMLTETYKFEERGKVQGANDFIVNAGVTVSAFSAGVVNHQWGWRTANFIVLSCVTLVFLLLIWQRFATRAPAAVSSTAQS